MPVEGFPCVLKPPVNADLIGYNIGNIVSNHKTVFFCVDQPQCSKSARTPLIEIMVLPVADRICGPSGTGKRKSDIKKAPLLRRAALKTMNIHVLVP